jgi:hypothetical protein
VACTVSLLGLSLLQHANHPGAYAHTGYQPPWPPSAFPIFLTLELPSFYAVPVLPTAHRPACASHWHPKN